MLVLDSGGLSRLSKRDRETAALIIALRRHGLWPPVAATAILVESLTGSPRRDANTNRLLKACDLQQNVTERIARRAAELRTRAHKGSAVDAIVVAMAEPGSVVLTADADDIQALACNALGVAVEAI